MFGWYFAVTAPYGVLARLAWLELVWYAREGRAEGPDRVTLRSQLSGAAVFFIIALGMAATYVAWQIFDARYLLVPSASIVMAAWLTAGALLQTAHTRANNVSHCSAQLCRVNHRPDSVAHVLYHCRWTAVGGHGTAPLCGGIR